MHFGSDYIRKHFLGCFNLFLHVKIRLKGVATALRLARLFLSFFFF